MKKINNLHNKTKEIEEEELPYNINNIILSENNLQELFNINGLNDLKFNNINLYRVAFVHKSYCNMKNADFESGNIKCPEGYIPLQISSYERLEFLGDSILGMIIANYLYERFPEQNEGFLSKIRTKIVNGKTLGDLSYKIGFQKYAIISKQVEEANGRNNYKIMEDIFEAFIGALFLDFQINNEGFKIAEKWIINIIEKYIDFSDIIIKKTNYKDILINYMQHNLQDIPRFYELSITTKNNNKIFNYCIKDRYNSIIATASGLTKKEAENNVSKEALRNYNQSIDE